MGGYGSHALRTSRKPVIHDGAHNCRLFDAISKYYPTDMIMHHDDWGRSATPLRRAMMDSIVYEPTELLSGTRNPEKTFHCCGRVERFMP